MTREFSDQKNVFFFYKRVIVKYSIPPPILENKKTKFEIVYPCWNMFGITKMEKLALFRKRSGFSIKRINGMSST